MQTLRLITQIFGTVISHAYLKVFSTKMIYSGPLKATCMPFITCYSCPVAVYSCPIGTIQHYMIIRQLPFIVLGHLILVLTAVGRMVCGWVCPVGLVQDLAYKAKTPKITISKKWNYFKYIALIGLVLLIPYISGQALFCHLCPVGTFESAIPWVVWNPINPEFQQPTVDTSAIDYLFVIKIVILLIIIGLIIVSSRPFCRIICPLALIFAPFNRLSLVKMDVLNRSSCGSCNECLRVCPMEIRISDDPNSGECIRCLECTKCKKVKIGIGDLNEEVKLPY